MKLSAQWLIVVIWTLLLGAGVSGCASTTEGKLMQAHQLTAGLRQSAKAVLDLRCEDAAKACVASHVDEASCSKLHECQNARRLIYAAATTVQVAIAAAAGYYAVGDEASAQKAFEEAKKALNKLRALFDKYKVLEVLG